MKKHFVGGLAILFGIVCANPVLALRWSTNAGIRVQSMGNATLGIEDETTDLTIFNHQNAAGRVLNEKKDRLDYALYYSTRDWKLDLTSAIWENKYNDSGLDRPGGEYRGLTYWAGDNLVFQANLEGATRYFIDQSTTATGVWKDQFNSYMFGGGLSAAYKLDMGLAIGAGISYMGANGKPDSLNGSYHLAPLMFWPVTDIPGTTTTKFEVSAANLDWSAALAYEIENLGENGRLVVGLGVHGDDSPPLFGGDAGPYLSPSAYMLGSYRGTVTLEGNVPSLGDVSSKYTLTQMPLVVNAEAIYKLGNWMSAGLLIDYLLNEYHRKVEYKGFEALAPTLQPANYSQKEAVLRQWGITPVVRSQIAVAEDITLLPGISYSTWGSGRQESYAHDSSFSDPGQTYKSGASDTTVGLVAVGVGVQTLSKRLQGALQYENVTRKMEGTSYAVDGTSIARISVDGGIQNNYLIGVEFQLMPEMAIRAGYALLQTVFKDGAYDTSGNTVDLKLNTNRITAGLGVHVQRGLELDLLGVFDMIAAEPKSTPEPTDTAINLLLGIHMEL